MQLVHTVTFPDAALLSRLQPLPSLLRPLVWDMRSNPEGAGLDEIDAVILPYLNAGEVLGELRNVPDRKMEVTCLRRAHCCTPSWSGGLAVV